MPIEITMPQLSDTMDEGKILTWLKQEGDQVSRGDALAEVETDKADLEIESFHEGTLLKISAPIGTTVKVGTVIALIGEAGEAVSDSPSVAPSAEQEEAPSNVIELPSAQSQPVVPPQPVVEEAPAVAPVAASPDGERVKISPLARNLAQTHGVDYSNLSGTGDGGRIVKRDIENQLGRELSVSEPAAAPAPVTTPSPSAAPSPAPRSAPVRTGNVGEVTQPLSKMRQTIASRMVESTSSIPHFFVTSKIRVDELVRMRASLKTLPQYEGLTYNHLIIKAAALALRVVPRINAFYQDDQLVQPQAINVGIVTAVTDGLLIPVVKNADELHLADLVSDSRALVSRARSGRPKGDDLSGGTFSISNMGLFAVEDFTAIINPGQGAILAVSSIDKEPVVEDDKIVPGQVMRLTLSVDHRIIDGVIAGEFLTELKRLLEDPVLLLA